MKEFYTIIINGKKFIPKISEREHYYHLEYELTGFGRLGYSVLKTQPMKVIKRNITNEIYNILNSKC